jgi:hypothetical protein
LSAATGKARAKINNQTEKPAVTKKPATKTAAAKASDAGRATRSRPEPKWAALARARKQRMRRGSQRSA